MPRLIFLSLKRLILSGCAAVALSACAATVDQSGTFADLSASVGDRAGGELAWRKDSGAAAQIDTRIAELLAAPLTLDGAVQLTLLANGDLQARFADLGMAKADLVAAGLIENPVLDVSVRATDHLAVLEFGIFQNLLDVLMRPSREKVADAAYRAEASAVAQDVVSAVGETRRSYFALLGARNAAAVLDEVRSAAEASSELAAQFHAAGNISDLELAEEQASYQDALIAADMARIHAAEAERDFNHAVGSPEAAAQVGETLPAPPPAAMAAADFDSALAHRLDLAAARRGVDAAVAELKHVTDYRLWQQLEIGAAVEREDDGEWTAGPAFALSLPLFNQGQPEVARSAMAVLKAENQVKALEGSIRAEVRAARTKVDVMSELLGRYTAKVLPLKAEIVRLKQREYNFMLVGAFELLIAKREEGEAYHQYIEALGEYWRARVDLLDAMGGGPMKVGTSTGGPA
ncbi:MAG: TolC family protein [Rhodobacteraceae bacterium]|nr:TolC family protein [Paracoccaceae bacterium]